MLLRLMLCRRHHLGRSFAAVASLADAWLLTLVLYGLDGCFAVFSWVDALPPLLYFRHLVLSFENYGHDVSFFAGFDVLVVALS
jgi:hypothetical protein